MRVAGRRSVRAPLALLALLLAAGGCGKRARTVCKIEGGISALAISGSDLWIGHKTAGLLRVATTGGPVEDLSAKAGLEGGRKDVRALAIDGDSAWLATGAGVVQFSLKNRTVVRAWTAKDGLGSDSVRCIVAAGGQVWAGTIFGASRLLPGGARWKNYQMAQGLSQNHVYRLVEHGGILWASCINGGLARFDPAPDRWVSIPQEHGIGNKYIYAMEADADGQALWLGTAGGVNRYAPASGWDVPVCDNGFTDYSVYAIHREGGILWFGTTYGLYRRDLAKGTQTILGASAGLAGEDVVALLAVPPALFVATRTGISSLPLN